MLDREKLKRPGIKVVEATDEDEKTAIVHFGSKEAVEVVKTSLKATAKS
jgi:hypothetical protein